MPLPLQSYRGRTEGLSFGDILRLACATYVVLLHTPLFGVRLVTISCRVERDTANCGRLHVGDTTHRLPRHFVYLPVICDLEQRSFFVHYNDAVNRVYNEKIGTEILFSV